MTEQKFKKILVPFDGSKFSKKAAAKSIILAKKLGSKVFFITVVSGNDIPSSNELLGLLKDDKKAQREMHRVVCAIRIELKKLLQDQVNTCRKRKIPAKYDILSGHPIDKILQCSKKEKIDLIVLGSHGLTGLSKIKALGSVARGISELAKCPVMIVKS